MAKKKMAERKRYMLIIARDGQIEAPIIAQSEDVIMQVAYEVAFDNLDEDRDDISVFTIQGHRVKRLYDFDDMIADLTPDEDED